MSPNTVSESLGLQELVVELCQGCRKEPLCQTGTTKSPRPVRVVCRNSAMLDSTVVLMVGLCHTLGLVHHVLVCFASVSTLHIPIHLLCCLNTILFFISILSSFTTEKTYTRSALSFFILLIDCITTGAPSYTFGVRNNSGR